MMSFPEPTQWNGDPEPEQEWDCEPEEDDPADCMDCGVCDNCVERTRAYYEEMESEAHDVEVERELIREANERHSELQDRRFFDLWVSLGLLVLLFLGAAGWKWWRLIFQ